jgi:DNA-binding IclR family transcriptional regulator
VRRAGHATDDGRFRRGITAIAAPVFSADGSVRRAISITTITAQLDARGRRQLTRAVLDAAAEIAQALR